MNCRAGVETLGCLPPAMHDAVLLGSSGGWEMGVWSGLKAWRGRYFKASGRRGNGLGAWWAQDPACHLGEEVGWV